jgi:hypothetical protein
MQKMRKLKLFLFMLLIAEWSSYSQDILIAKTPDSIHNTVVAIMRLDSTGKVLSRASGVLINSRVILTAGHVNYKRYPDGLDRRGFIAASPKALQTTNYIPFDWINNVETHPDLIERGKILKDTTSLLNPNNFLDIGLIFLDTPIEKMPIAKLPKPSFFKSLPEGTSFLGVGYGYHKVRDVSFKYSFIDGVRRKWKPKSVTAINDLYLMGTCDTSSNQPFTSVGDSGAPLFINDTIIMAITIGATPVPNSSLFVRIDNPIVLDWIKNAVKKRLGIDL